MQLDAEDTSICCDDTCKVIHNFYRVLPFQLAPNLRQGFLFRYIFHGYSSRNSNVAHLSNIKRSLLLGTYSYVAQNTLRDIPQLFGEHVQMNISQNGSGSVE